MKLQVELTCESEPTISTATCSCVIGKKGAFVHVTALLYTIAQFKMLKFTLITDDVACTSKNQTWHNPKGEKIRGQEVQTLEVVRSARRTKHNSSSAHCSDDIKSVMSTLYNH